MRCPAHPMLHGKMDTFAYHLVCMVCGLAVVRVEHYRMLERCCGNVDAHYNTKVLEDLMQSLRD